jgi:S1-C subfamily serine protease
MAVLMSCPGCLKRLRASEELAGKRVKCSRCGMAFVVSIKDMPKVPDTAPEPPPLAKTAEPETIPPLDFPKIQVEAVEYSAPPKSSKMVLTRVGPLAALALVALVVLVAVVARSLTNKKLPSSQLIESNQAMAQSIEGPLSASDPDGDCQVHFGKDSVTFQVPGTFHDLTCLSGIAPASGKRNAPRALLGVSGNFTAEAIVDGTFRPFGEATGIGAPYHGAGLLLWKDADNFVRLERATVIRPDSVQEFVNFVLCRDGWVEQVEIAALPIGTVELRLERKDREIVGSVRTENGHWLRVEEFSVAWPETLLVGAAAVNSSKTPLECRIDKLSIRGVTPTRPLNVAEVARAMRKSADEKPPEPAPTEPVKLAPVTAPIVAIPGKAAEAVDLSDRPLTTAEIVEKCEPSVALVRGKSSSGTGFVVRPGIIATNAHVIEDELLGNLEVRFPSATGEFAQAQPVELLYEDRTRDLAILRAKQTPPPLVVARTFRYVKGEDVVVIGNPGIGGGELTLENAVCRGVLSVKAVLEGKEFYQLGIAINPGNSGGPVFDTKGRVIGVATLKTTKQEALAFCIPAAALGEALDRLDARNPAEIEAQRSKHQIMPMFKLLACRGAVYASVLDLHLGAKSRGMAMNDAKLVEARDAVAKLESTLFSGLEKAVGTVRSDARLPRETRDDLAKLGNDMSTLQDLLKKASQSHLDAVSARLGAVKRSYRDTVVRLAKRVGEEVPAGLLAAFDASPGGEIGNSDVAALPGQPRSLLPFPMVPDMPGFRDRFGVGPRFNSIGPRGRSTLMPPMPGSRITPRSRTSPFGR